MPLAPGTMLGPYEVLAPLGAGGMGEVYRARDTRLERSVAIKVLPAHLAGDPLLRQRLEREARSISSLNHPHICALYDVGHHEGADYLVMEFLEGETLAQRLEKGPLPLDQLLRLGIQVTDALDKAHRQGVVHRDLKPGNIMLTKSGAKLLDFGLAKANPLAAVANFTTSPTRSQPLTADGAIVGTYQYMSPEQLEGREADARSDIFAFGAVLYEMACGQKAFQGRSQASLIAAILEKEPPPVSVAQPMAPPALERVVKTCLAKDPEARWQTAHDLKLQLEWILEGGSLAGVPAPVAVRRRTREGLWMAAAALATLAALGLGWGYYRAVSVPQLTVRAFIPPPEKTQFHSTGPRAGPLAVSPDGRRIAFSAIAADGKVYLWVRPLDSAAAQLLDGTEGAEHPFWSPDSRFLGFFAEGKLKKIDAGGGPPVSICAAPDARGGTWNRDDVILFSAAAGSPILRVSASGGTPQEVTKFDTQRGESTHRWPVFLPDGNRFLYLARASTGPGGEATSLRVGSLDGRVSRVLPSTRSNAAYADGYLLFVREGTLVAQRFDTAALEPEGDAVPIAEQVQFDLQFTRGVFSVSQTGVLAYQTGAGTAGAQLTWFDSTGKQVSVLGEPGLFFNPRLSPDGKRAVLGAPDAQGNTDIWMVDLARGVRTRFTFHSAAERGAIWSPDGTRIVFDSNRKALFNLYVKPSSGALEEELLLETGENMFPTDWSPDGRYVFFNSTDATGKTRGDIFHLPMTGPDRKPIPFLETPFDEINGRFSPDGRWVAYASDEAGDYQVFVRPFPGPGGKWQVSTGGGVQPRWRRDGKAVFYLTANNRLMEAEVKARGDAFEVGQVRPLFEMRPLRPGSFYDVAADGRRFLISTLMREVSSSPITLVLRWTADVKR